MNKLITIIILVFSVTLSAQSKFGTTAANFLTIPVGSRASGMGGAFVAVANDVTAAYWNPGGLSRLQSNEFNVNHADWLVNTKLDWAGIVMKLSESDAFAISLYQLDYGEEEITTVKQQNGTGQTWSASDIAISLSYARNLTDAFSIGGTVKYIQQKIWNESASAFAIDIGLLFTTQFNGLRLGMNIANFGTGMKLAGKDLLQPIDIDPAHAGNNANITTDLDTDSWNLPLVFSVGLSYDFLKNEDWTFTVATDALIPNNQTSYLNLGGELVWDNILFLRGGYNSLFKDFAEEGLTAGAGLQYDFGGVRVRADYSYMDFGKFNEISRYSVSIGF
ncbi:hypothetical protein BMS3Abin04_02727 [bacterium BMS3Abin04]|nr:hypothetical protein BMS3Abin04_02727 [bacterium BMS3Abin04]